MAKHHLKQINGHFVESDFENALISFLEQEGWHYLYGDTIPRASRKEVLYMDDFVLFLKKNNPDLEDEDVIQIAENVRLVGDESDFATLHKVYGWMVNGVQHVTKNGDAKMVALIEFEKEKADSNIFRVVNQFTVEYVNNGEKKVRRPDVLLYVNGIPVCVMELKNPADESATINDAWRHSASIALLSIGLHQRRSENPPGDCSHTIRTFLCLETCGGWRQSFDHAF